MALTDESGNMVMPVSPMYGNVNGGNYSNHGDLRMEIQEIMQDAPNDYVRQKLMDAMEGM